MALINTLRNKMGKVIVGLVAFAILSFILADLLGPNSIMLNRNSNNVGEIAGESISYTEYQQQVDIFINNYVANFGRNPTDREMGTIRNQAWELLIVDRAFQIEYDALGLDVVEDEVVDLVQGKNISSEITAATIFANPQTGVFDRDMLAAFLSNFNSQPVQLQSQWYAFESNLRPARLRIKYDNLLSKSNNVTEEEAKKYYMQQASSADIKYVYVPFTAVNDSLVEVSDAELERYLKEHADDFQVKASRTIEYVNFPVIASSEDSTFFEKDIEDMKDEFEQVTDDSVFAKINTDGFSFYSTYTPKLLPTLLQENIDNLAEGKVYGPVLESGSYKIYKVVSVFEDTLNSARTSHILFKWDSDTPEAKNKAKAEGQRVLNEIKNGADFAEMANRYGTDGTASRGGDLGWFETGNMVKPFQDAVFSATKAGLLKNLVETEFGYHVIEVTHVKTNKQYIAATIERTVFASDETLNKAFRKADYFAGTNTSYNEFKKSAEADSLQIRESSNIRVDQSDISGIGSARQIVRWLSNDASKGEVSDVFDLDDQYIVAVMTGEIKEGTSKLENIRFQIERKVINEKKAEYIISKLIELSGSIEEIAESFGEGANVNEMTGLKANLNTITGVGNAPEAVGVVFAMEAGQVSSPIKTQSGVMVIEVSAINQASEIADYSAYKDQILSSRSGRTSYYTSEAIKDAANIKDERYRFY